jgi:hypothetical protein
VGIETTAVESERRNSIIMEERKEISEIILMGKLKKHKISYLRIHYRLTQIPALAA